MFDATNRVKELWAYYDAMLDKRLDEIAEKSGVDRARLIKINPAEFIEKTSYQQIKGYKYKKIKDHIQEYKTDETFLISPLDAIEETAEQIGYKARETVKRKIRAAKCEIYPVSKELARDFCIRNHRQTQPLIHKTAVYLGLVFQNELVALMGYDLQTGAVRGNNRNYELVRLAISRGTQIYGGASKLQKECENVLRMMGVTQIFSYSNATINTGSVYKALGFQKGKLLDGQPFVILQDNSLERLANLHPFSTNEILASKGLLKTHISGNLTWTKDITTPTEENDS